MNHGSKHYKLNRRMGHRKALFLNLCKALIEHKRIKTTITKAKAIKPIVERLVTKARNSGGISNLHTYKNMLSFFQQDEEITKKLYDEVAPKYASRPGGYTRIVRHSMRPDQTEVVIIEFVDFA